MGSAGVAREALNDIILDRASEAIDGAREALNAWREIIIDGV